MRSAVIIPVSGRLRTWLFFMAVVVTGAAQAGQADVDFTRLGGSDLGMGIGARAMGMGGAFVAVADDASAAFWNPAGLTRLDDNQLLVSADPAEDFGAAVAVVRPKTAFFRKNRLTFGIGYVNRLSFQGDSGSGDWSGYPAHLLDMAMIDVPDDFQGTVDSRTYDLRFSMAFVLPQWKKPAVGINFIHIS